MKVNVTLVNPPYPSGAPESIFLPLGLSYLAAILENNGCVVDVIDCQVTKLTQRQLEDKLIQLQPDIVGVTSATLTYKPALEIVKTAKGVCPKCWTILGGSHVTVLDEKTLSEQPEVDIVVRGEGEQTILELVHLISNSNLTRASKRLDEVDGITFRKNEKIIHMPNRPFIQNLDQLPYPAHKHFPLDKYRIFGKTYLPIITSRGCPFQCTFCLVSRMCGRRFRARSPENVVDELEWLKDAYGADAFAFYDDTFTFDKKRALEICEEMKKRNIDLPWDCRTRVDQVSKQLLAKIRDANCQLVHFGVESGSQKILNAMKKGVTVEQNERAIMWAKEADLSVAISVVFGYPGETKDTLMQTLDFIEKTDPDNVYVCVAVPYPGTELQKVLQDLGWKMSTEWNRYHEDTMVFKNPFLSAKEIMETRKKFYNHFFSPSYVVQKKLKRGFYNQIMARTALNHLLWRINLPAWVSVNFKKLGRQQKGMDF